MPTSSRESSPEPRIPVPTVREAIGARAVAQPTQSVNESFRTPEVQITHGNPVSPPALHGDGCVRFDPELNPLRMRKGWAVLERGFFATGLPLYARSTPSPTPPPRLT